MRRIGLAAATVCLGLAALGLALVLSASASGSTPSSSPSVQVDSTGCLENGAGGRPLVGYCVFVLTDGRRFQCPLRFGNHPQTPTSLEHAEACHPLSPIRIPASWKPALRRLDRVEACLARRGLTARGGPFFGANPRRGPIGELVVEVKPVAIIGFYTNAKVARRAEPGVISAVRRTGGSAERHGAVTVAWSSSPSSQVSGPVDSCATP